MKILLFCQTFHVSFENDTCINLTIKSVSPFELIILFHEHKIDRKTHVTPSLSWKNTVSYRRSSIQNNKTKAPTFRYAIGVI